MLVTPQDTTGLFPIMDRLFMVLAITIDLGMVLTIIPDLSPMDLVYIIILGPGGASHLE